MFGLSFHVGAGDALQVITYKNWTYNGSGAERRATSVEPAKPVAAAERVRSSDWLGRDRKRSVARLFRPSSLVTLILQGCVERPVASDLEVNEEHEGS